MYIYTYIYIYIHIYISYICVYIYNVCTYIFVNAQYKYLSESIYTAKLILFFCILIDHKFHLHCILYYVLLYTINVHLYADKKLDLYIR